MDYILGSPAVVVILGLLGVLWSYCIPAGALFVGFHFAVFSDAAYKETIDYQLQYGPQFQKASMKEERKNPFAWIIYRFLGQGCIAIGLHELIALFPIAGKIGIPSLALFTALLTAYGLWAVSYPAEAHRFRGHKPFGSNNGNGFTKKQAILGGRISGILSLALSSFLFWLIRWHGDFLC